MSDSTFRSGSDALAREWMAVAVRARARHLRRLLAYTALMLLMALGVMQYGAILMWAVRNTAWWALVPVGLHASCVVLAIGWPVRSGTSLLAPAQGFKRNIAGRFGDRVERLRALRAVVAMECALLLAWPIVRFVVSGTSPRWGVTFTTALCTLAILWPLQRITNAQRAESRRLLSVEDLDPR